MAMMVIPAEGSLGSAVNCCDLVDSAADNTAGCHRHRFVGRFATVRVAFQISPQLVHRQ
jgi:hypothetical protein